MEPRQFGSQEPGWRYVQRPGAYALIRNEARELLIVRNLDGNCGLPGGGIDDGESAEQALCREVLEETGHEIVVSHELCRANQYLIAPEESRAYNKQGIFYVAQLGRRVADPTEPDHFAEWLAVAEAAIELTEESQRWALAQLLGR